uniref:Protein HLB1 n=1 Tax=Ananas comosus var. bracteatus TaxID=296719 RepID=A0A6V7QNZ7_ANACO|nr:unnamed protein product [Ananas comosus var. bracteatus]
MEETDPRSGDPLELPNGSSPEPLAAEPAAASHTESAAPLPEHEATESEIEPAEESKEGEIAQEQAEDDSKPSAADAEAEAEEEEAPSGEGSRAVTMRELLNELKEEKGGEGMERSGSAEGDARGSSYNQDGTQLNSSQNDVAMELINSVTGVDEEGRSRQRILSFAAKRYVSAIERNPEDPDAYYNWALVLQESADNVDPNSSSSKDALLEEACKKYAEATRLCPTLYDAYYNWAIAIADRAKMRGRTKEAEELWKQAIKNYEKAVQLNWNSPQELSAIVPLREKHTIIKTAISKFRAAIQLQFDFHRAIYNLGTVLYGLAEDTLRSGRQVNGKDVSPNELYSQSAIYVAAAHALKPNYSVYRSALRLVRSMLPLPYLKVGYLTAPPANNTIAPHKDWERSQFVLNHEGLQQVTGSERHFSESPSNRLHRSTSVDKTLIKVDVADIVSVSACADLTLPPGAGLCIDTIHGPVFLVADTWESLDGWLDAIRLVYTIFARGKSDVLAGVITG